MTSTSPRTSGVFPVSAIVQGSQVIIHSVDRLVNTTFICTVTNAVGTGRAEQQVLVRGEWVSGVACDDQVCSQVLGLRWRRLCRRLGEGSRPASLMREEVVWLPLSPPDWGDRVSVGRGVRSMRPVLGTS